MDAQRYSSRAIFRTRGAIGAVRALSSLVPAGTRGRRHSLPRVSKHARRSDEDGYRVPLNERTWSVFRGGGAAPRRPAIAQRRR